MIGIRKTPETIPGKFRYASNPFFVISCLWWEFGKVESYEATESEKETKVREEEYSSQVHSDMGTGIQDNLESIPFRRVSRKEKRRNARRAWRNKWGSWTDRNL